VSQEPVRCAWALGGGPSIGTAYIDYHDAVWGVEYRYQADRVANLTPFIGFLPPDRDLRTASLFGQDVFTVHERVELTGGVRFERNEFTDWEVLPNARLAWKPKDARLLWAAASRAVRAPSRRFNLSERKVFAK